MVMQTVQTYSPSGELLDETTIDVPQSAAPIDPIQAQIDALTTAILGGTA